MIFKLLCDNKVYNTEIYFINLNEETGSYSNERIRDNVIYVMQFDFYSNGKLLSKNGLKKSSHENTYLALLNK